MDQQPLTRIGAGVPAKRERRRLWFGIRPEFVIAAAVLIAMGGAIAAVYGLNPPQSAPAVASTPSRPIEVEVECANIKHAYTNWRSGIDELRGMHELPPGAAKLELKMVGDDGKEFLRVASGHKDQPSKELASRIAQNNYDVSFMGLELQLGGEFSGESQQKAMASWKAADDAYSSFLALTCS